ncbi:unnamed protein product, partial [marine sediment metagenome]
GSVTPDTGRVTTDFTFTVTYTDADNDAPNSPTVSIDGGEPQEMVAQDPGDENYADGKVYQYTTSGLTKNVGHTFQFAASDGFNNATGDIGVNAGPDVANTPPWSPGVIFTPENPLTGDDLVCTIITDSYDADGDTITYSYEWLKDSIGQGELTTNTVDYSFTARGDNWRVYIYPHDGEEEGTGVVWDYPAIGNTPPTAPTVVVTPDLPLPEYDLVCTITAASTDADGDGVTYTYQWYKDGVLQDTLTTDTVDFSLTTAGDTWR